MKFGAYESLGVLGSGAMGVVYKGRTRDGRLVAIKVLRRPTPALLQRFEREKRLLKRLGGAGFVAVLDDGESPEGPYIVMPYLGGGTLRDRLDKTTLSIDQAIVLARTLAAALGRAHALGIVHRDLKPDNVMFDDAAKPTIADLGLGKHWERSMPGGSLSQSLSKAGLLAGTAGYMAPEQLGSAEEATPSCDVFSLGVILYESLTRRMPFAANTIYEFAAAVHSTTFEPVMAARPDTPPWLAQVVHRCLGPTPDTRYADGAELARALFPEAKPPSRSRPVVLRTTGFLLAAGLVVTGAALLSRAPEPVAPSVDENAKIATTNAPLPLRATSQADGVVYLQRADSLREHEQYAKALADYDRALELDPHLVAAWTGKSAAHRSLHDLDSAIADASHALELDTTLALAWCCRSAARAEHGDLELAISDADRAIELDKNLALAWSSRGEALRLRGDLPGAFNDLSQALKLSPDALTYARRALAYSSSADYEHALADANTALELEPKNAVAYKVRASAFLNSGASEPALQAADEAIKRDPRYAAAWTARAAAHLLLGHFDLAIQDATRAVELSPADNVAYGVRGEARFQRGELEAAVSDLDEAVRLSVHFSRAHLMRARVRGRMGWVAGAVADLETVLQNPNDPLCPEARTELERLPR